MKTLTWIFSCFLIIACVKNTSSLHNATQEKLKNKLEIISGRSYEQKPERDSIHILIFPEKSSPGIFRATLAIDQKNDKQNFSIKDLISSITAFVISAGFVKVDCLPDQLACFAKKDASLFFEPTKTPEAIRLELRIPQTSMGKVADATAKIFIEGLLFHLRQQP